MAHSNSSLNSFLSCMKMYELQYIKRVTLKEVSPHLTFGSMAHDCLYKAGKLRDEVKDGVIQPGEYSQTIPSEVLYGDLKEFFGIKSWNNYFMQVIKKIAEYENDIVKNFKRPIIEREVKLQRTPQELWTVEGVNLKQPLVGVIDLLIREEDNSAAVILDYKFSTSRKNQDNFDHDSQLYLYAYLINKTYGVPVRNIKVGYIDIPKQAFDAPTVLTNGTLSRSKSQNVSAEFYKKSVIAIHGNDPYYNCDEGGHYHETYLALTNNKAAYLQTQYVDEGIYKNVIKDVFNTARLIDFMREETCEFCRKYDAHSCKNCAYLAHCKPWLGIDFGRNM